MIMGRWKLSCIQFSLLSTSIHHMLHRPSRVLAGLPSQTCSIILLVSAYYYSMIVRTNVPNPTLIISCIKGAVRCLHMQSHTNYDVMLLHHGMPHDQAQIIMGDADEDFGYSEVLLWTTFIHRYYLFSAVQLSIALPHYHHSAFLAFNLPSLDQVFL